MTAAKTKGWKITPAALARANLASMAATPVGPHYLPALSDSLFDDLAP
jgi:hypothetical protein